MFNAKLQSKLAYVLKESGLFNCPQFYLDRTFIAAVLAGIAVVWLLHDWIPVFSSNLTLHWMLLISVLIWQPLFEELLFRGIIQGQLSKSKWAQQSLLNITAANMVTSALFVAIHILNTSLIWSLTIFIPSLLYGYFRDTFKSVYPAMVLHSIYNLIVVLGLVIYR